MKLSTKLYMLTGILLLVFLGFGIFSLYQMASINAQSTLIAGRYVPNIVSTQTLNRLALSYRSFQLRHILAEDPKEIERWDNALKQQLKDVNDLAAKTVANIRTASRRVELLEAIELWEDYVAVGEEMLVLSRQGRREEAITLLRTGSDDYNAMSAMLISVGEMIVDGSNEASSAGSAAYASARTITITIISLSLLLGLFATVYTIRGVLRQLGKDPNILGMLAQRVTEGDYDIDDGSPQIGVYGNLIKMVSALKEQIMKATQESKRAAEGSEAAKAAMIEAEKASNEAQEKTKAMLETADRLEEVAQVVSSASTELSAQIEQSGRGAEQQAGMASEVATAMEEMNATVLEVAKNASVASDVSGHTKQKAEEGAEVVGKAVASIQKVSEESLTMKEAMAELTQHAQSINQIMGVISDIADQTNLLALNAAIEAARAGDAGRGFAVVADEVRNLAEKTMSSTSDVGNAIRAIQDSAAKNMDQVNNVVNMISEATDYTEESGKVLQEIVSMAEETASQVQGIATASEEQSAASEEISNSVSQVNAIAGETAQTMVESARAVSDLAQQAHGLTELIEAMKRG